MNNTDADKRLGWRGTRLGIYSGAVGGGLSGFLAVNFWGFWEILPRIIRRQEFGFSDPVTPQMAAINVIFNSIFFGLSVGLIGGALVGAIAGRFVRRERAEGVRLGRWIGTAGLSLMGLLIRPEGWLAVIVFVFGNALIGAAGGSLGDRMFVYFYRREAAGSSV